MIDIEGRLRERWDREVLAVYADALQSAGDPRGELIAIDLHVDAHGRSDELARRKDELLGKLLGIHRNSAQCRYGFIGFDLSAIESTRPLADVLGGPLAGYIRDVVASGAPTIALVARLLSQGTHPWLTRLALEARGALGPTLVGEGGTAALAKALPNLDHLEVLGSPGVTRLVHPRLRSLRVTGLWALTELVDRASLQALESLDLSLPEGRPSVPVLARERFPALRRLDLARNAPPDTERTIDAIGMLELEPIVAQLTHLRIPVIESLAAKQRLDRVIARMPKLVELEVRSHLSELQPAVTVEPLPRCWRAIDHIRSRAPLRIETTAGAFAVDLGEAVDVLEGSYRDLPPSVRAAWDTWFNTCLRGQRWGGPGQHERYPFAAATVRMALDGTIDRFVGQDWHALHRALAHAGRQAAIAALPYRA